MTEAPCLTPAGTVVRRIAVIGGGTMGRGIVHVALASGFEVALADASAEALSAAGAAVARSLDKAVARGKLDAAARAACDDRLTLAPSAAAAAEGSDLAIEAVPEVVAVKAAVYAALAEQLPPHAVIASNTSSLPMTALAAASDRPSRFVGAHFFNPPYVLRLLELIRAEQTSEETIATLRAVGAAMGREVIEVRDFPGFATSRLGVALGNEAMRMLEQGVASAADIDRAMVLGYRHPMGPLELTDLVGLDVRLAISEHLHRELGSDTFQPPLILRRLVRAGRLGRKSGRGFYRWDGGRRRHESAETDA